MTPVVLDASLALAAVLPDESSISVESLLREAAEGRVEILSAPQWKLEIANGIHQAFRRKRITARDRLEFHDALMRFPIRLIDRDPDAAALFAVADTDGLSIYDAAYLAIALEEGALLATEDAAMKRAARRRGVDWKPGAARARP
jgi:predicted nucleic acid-binding protein